MNAPMGGPTKDVIGYNEITRNRLRILDLVSSAMVSVDSHHVPLTFVSHRVGLRVYDPGSIPSLTHSSLVRTRLSAHNASQERYRSQFP
jgi:hypothetical protein